MVEGAVPARSARATKVARVAFVAQGCAGAIATAARGAHRATHWCGELLLRPVWVSQGFVGAIVIWQHLHFGVAGVEQGRLERSPRNLTAIVVTIDARHGTARDALRLVVPPLELTGGTRFACT